MTSSCALNDGTVIRLYRGNAGATVAFWYSVTDDPPGFSPERQIIFSYSEPELASLTCGTDKFDVESPDRAPIETPITATERLHAEPLAFWRGKQGPVERQDQTFSRAFAGLLIVLGVAILVRRA